MTPRCSTTSRYISKVAPSTSLPATAIGPSTACSLDSLSTLASTGSTSSREGISTALSNQVFSLYCRLSADFFLSSVCHS